MGLLFELWLVNCNGFEPKPMDWSQAEFRYSHDGPWGATVLAPKFAAHLPSRLAPGITTRMGLDAFNAFGRQVQTRIEQTSPARLWRTSKKRSAAISYGIADSGLATTRLMGPSPRQEPSPKPTANSSWRVK